MNVQRAASEAVWGCRLFYLQNIEERPNDIHDENAFCATVAAVLGIAALVAPALAQSAPQCVVSGSPPAGWGFNSIGYIEIASGSSCLFTVNINGEILSSSVSQAPANGTLQQLDLSSFLYTSQAGYGATTTIQQPAEVKRVLARQ